MGVAATRISQVVQVRELAVQAATSRVRFLGREFVVVPAVLVRSQVLQNNLGQSYLPPEVFTAEWAAAWNGIGVLVGPHPTLRGVAISGRTAALWDARGVGWVFNARIDTARGAPALKADVYLDVARVAEVAEFAEVLDAVERHEAVELSTGFVALMEDVDGVSADGVPYGVVLEPQGADHLVISTVLTGACSVRDGCGLGVNQTRGGGVMSTAVAGMQAARAEAAAGADEVGAADGGDAPAVADKGPWARMWARAAALVRAKDTTHPVWAEHVAATVARTMAALQQIAPSDQERISRVSAALEAALGTADRHVVLVELYSAEQYVVFFCMTPFGPEPLGSEYYRAAFTQNAAGAYTFGSPEGVRRVTVYEPVAAAEVATNTAECGCGGGEGKGINQGGSMPKDEGAKGAAEGTAAAEVAEVGLVGEAVAAMTTEVRAAVAAMQAEVAAVKTTLAALSTAVHAERDAERAALVTELSTGERTPFSADELKDRPLAELRKLAVLARVDLGPVSFTGRGGPRSGAVAAEAAFVEPVPYYQEKGAAANGAAAGTQTTEK
jgi:hypothetical protein